ncbi:MAG TPA: penicillin-binding protein 2 [Acidimicrobiales bacterium]|nr:penicillin-binding protein 2 [Acidimicrobiales bacterium]
MTARRPPAGGRPARLAQSRGLGARGRLRAFGMLVVMVVAFLAIAAKLVVIQGFDSARYAAVGASEWKQSVTLAAERGAILDRNGNELAMSVPQTTIYADPHQVTDPRSEAASLAPVLGMSADTLQGDLSSSGSFVYLARTVPDSTAAEVAKLNLAGIYSLKEPKRFYPAGQLGAPLLGAVGTSGNGLGGLEYEYNPLLTGTPGKSVEQIDPQGRQIAGGMQEYQAPIPGQDLVLSIDEPLQYDAEQALAQAIVAAHAQGGIALLMDTRTGQILADAQLTMPTLGGNQTPAVPVSIPSPDKPSASTTNSPQPQPVEAPSAGAFTRVYEPGSVNKLITISAALEAGVIKPSDVFTIPNTFSVAGTTFHDAENHPTERWSVTDILVNSSNIGTIQIAQKLGKTNLLNYLHSYGLGSSTDIKFPGESSGLLPSYWSGTSIADVPIGQGIAVTAMQMTAAYNAMANGGVYVAPRLVDATIDAQGKEHPLAAPPSHRVVSPTVAREMTTMLDEVVRVGTGTAADLGPYTVAGKTGTALVPSPHGGYEAGHYVASFAGFVPAEDPQITGMVVIDDTPDYGAAASAPTFATIARDALHELGIPPEPKQPPAPGVPLASPKSATEAGEVAGAPLPGLATPPSVAPSTTVPAAGAGSSTASTTVPAAPHSPTPPQTTTTLPQTTTTTARSRSSPTTR